MRYIFALVSILHLAKPLFALDNKWHSLDSRIEKETVPLPDQPIFAVQVKEITARKMSGIEFKKHFKGDAFLKVLNSKERHHGYQYSGGLCELPRFKLAWSLSQPITWGERFRASGTCKGGGLYFSKLSKIKTYRLYGDHLRIIYVPDTAEIWPDSTGQKFKADRLVLGQRKSFSDIDMMTRDTHLRRQFAISENNPEPYDFALLLDKSKELSRNGKTLTQSGNLRDRTLREARRVGQTYYEAKLPPSEKLAKFIIAILALDRTMEKVKAIKSLVFLKYAKTHHEKHHGPGLKLRKQSTLELHYDDFSSSMAPLSTQSWWHDLRCELDDIFHSSTWREIDTKISAYFLEPEWREFFNQDPLAAMSEANHYAFFNYQVVSIMIQANPDFYHDIIRILSLRLEKSLYVHEIEYILSRLSAPESSDPVISEQLQSLDYLLM